MRNPASALLFAATISTHLIGSASGEHRLGRFGTRFRRSNVDSEDTTASSSTQHPTTTSVSSSSSSDDGISSASIGAAGSAEGNKVNELRPRSSSFFGGIFVDIGSSSSYVEETSTATDDALLFPTVAITTSTPTAWGPTPSSSTGLSSSLPSSSSSRSNTFSSSSLSNSLGSSSGSSSSSFAYSSSLGSTGFPSNVSPSSTSYYWTNTTSPTPTATSDSSITDSSTTPTSNSTSDACFTMPPGAIATVISVIHTKTITWFGAPEDYTEPYEPIDVPTPCPSESSTRSVLLSATECPASESCPSMAPYPTSTMGSTAGAEVSKIGTWTYTYYVTDKNPAVTFVSSSSSVPDYGGDENDSITNNNNNHQTATQRTDDKVPNYGGTPSQDPGPQQVKQPSRTDVVIEDRPTEVVINTLTITNNPASPSTTIVTVGTDVFTVGPTAVVGAGATVERQASNIYVAAPTTTTVNGLGVVISGSVAVVAGTTFAIGSSESTRTVNSQLVTIGPAGVGVGGVTVPVAAAASATQVIVAGGEIVTIMGNSVVVVEGTTFTYGPGSPTITKVVDDDTVYIGPSGVVIDGTTMGGISAGGSEMAYTIVGGATISEIGASIVVIEGVTYTVGPGTGTTTTVVGGETLTIGPDGVVIDDGQTLTYPFGPTMTTTLHPGSTATADQASATGADDEEDSGYTAGRRPDWSLALISTCIAIGVGFCGFMI